MEHVTGGNDQFQRLETNLLTVVVHSLTHLNEHLLKRGLRQVSCGRQLVAEHAVNNRVRGVGERNAITADVAAIERTVQYVSCKQFFRFNQRLCQVLGIDLTDADVIAVLNQHFGQREG